MVASFEAGTIREEILNNTAKIRLAGTFPCNRYTLPDFAFESFVKMRAWNTYKGYCCSCDLFLAVALEVYRVRGPASFTFYAYVF